MGIEALLILLFIFDIGLIILIYTYNPQGVINRFLSLLMIPITLTNLEMLLLYTAREHLPVQIGFNMAMWGLIFFFPPILKSAGENKAPFSSAREIMTIPFDLRD